MARFYDELYARTVKVWPSEEIVAFVEANRSMLVNREVVDIGCGAGRHAIYMARRGIAAYGIDQSAVAIEHARRWAEQENVNARFQVGDFHRLPYHDASFMGAIAWESMFFGVTAAVRQGIHDLFRVLRPEAAFCLLLKSQEDFRFHAFARLDEHCAESEQGIPVTCFTRKEIEAEFSRWAGELKIEVSNHTLDNGHNLVANFVVTGRKKSQG
jgi:ubiquinone/menaquinone biosynthesis C-methylase UbiE